MRSPCFSVALVFVCCIPILRAQESPVDNAVKPAGEIKIPPEMIALTLRVEATRSAAAGLEANEVILEKLRAGFPASGLPLEPEADFAFAAIDVGRRLIGLKKPTEAEFFFKEAEVALDKTIESTADEKKSDKAQFLSQRALVRANYLNKGEQAKADVEQALKLKPGDKNLERIKTTIVQENAAVFRTQTKSN